MLLLFFLLLQFPALAMEAPQDMPLEVRAEPPAEKPKLKVVEKAARHNLHLLKEAATEALMLAGETASMMGPRMILCFPRQTSPPA